MSQISLKRIISFVVVLMLVMSCATAFAETLRVQGLELTTEENVWLPLDGSVPDMPRTVDTQWYAEIKSQYPDLQLVVDKSTSHATTESVLNSLSSPSAPDVLVLDSSYQDIHAIMASGALMDLTDNPAIQQIISQIHPSISQIAYHDGHIYGVPIIVYEGFQVFSQYHNWAYAGYTSEDIPTSFEELLDFLDSWVERCQTDTYSSFWNIINKDSTGHSAIRQKYGYTDWLATILVRNHIAQCRIEGVPPVFNTPAILALLERTQALGAALYEYDHRSAQYSLFTDNISTSAQRGFMSSENTSNSIFYQLPTRLTNDAPLYMPLNVKVLVVNGHTSHPTQSVALLQTYFEQLSKFALSTTAETFERATQKFAAPLLMKEWNTEVVDSKSIYTAYTRAGLYGEIFDDLRNGNTAPLRERNLIQNEVAMRSVPVVSYQLLQRYQELIAPGIMFPLYSGFEAMNKEVASLITRFSQGKLTAPEFAAHLDALMTP